MLDGYIKTENVVNGRMIEAERPSRPPRGATFTTRADDFIRAGAEA
jgi:hypothetical protein